MQYTRSVEYINTHSAFAFTFSQDFFFALLASSCSLKNSNRKIVHEIWYLRISILCVYNRKMALTIFSCFFFFFAFPFLFLIAHSFYVIFVLNICMGFIALWQSCPKSNRRYDIIQNLFIYDRVNDGYCFTTLKASCNILTSASLTYKINVAI